MNPFFEHNLEFYTKLREIMKLVTGKIWKLRLGFARTKDSLNSKYSPANVDYLQQKIMTIFTRIIANIEALDGNEERLKSFFKIKWNEFKLNEDPLEICLLNNYDLIISEIEAFTHEADYFGLDSFGKIQNSDPFLVYLKTECNEIKLIMLKFFPEFKKTVDAYELAIEEEERPERPVRTPGDLKNILSEELELIRNDMINAMDFEIRKCLFEHELLRDLELEFNKLC